MNDRVLLAILAVILHRPNAPAYESVTAAAQLLEEVERHLESEYRRLRSADSG